MNRSLLAAAASGALLASSAAPAAQQGLYLGADMSAVNQVQDCGGIYRERGRGIDPFELMARKGGNLVRVRIWVHPGGKYSTLEDAMKTARRAKGAGMKVLLDFHYADSWADGGKQPIPAAWEKLSYQGQVDALYAYTRNVLSKFAAAGLMPDMVQVGNEINPEMLGTFVGKPIDWKRDSLIINAGIRAVRDAGRAAHKTPAIMLHVAQPENIVPWFTAATKAGVTGYDLIGISYYKKWSTRSIPELGATIAEARRRFHKNVIVVETAYPYTEDDYGKASVILGPDSLIAGYPATPEGQLKYLTDLTQTVVDSGGIGVVWWEPAWIDTSCKPPDVSGSPWENATWFDYRNGNEALPAFDFLGRTYRRP
jgi:arabinogalactan endo-1,4-beta-galactosidase